MSCLLCKFAGVTVWKPWRHLLLTVLEARSPRPRGGQSRRLPRVRTASLPRLSLQCEWLAGSHGHALADGGTAPVSALAFTWHSPWVLVRLQIFAFLRIPLTLVWAHPRLVVKKCLPSRRLRFNPWVRKVPWRRKWQPTPVFLPGRSHGQKSLRGYSSWSCKELDTT